MAQDLDLANIQAYGLDMLLYFDSFCKKHGLEYVIIGGTLLGAIRHGGFIPWDDDIDVFMSRPQYEKLADLTYRNSDYVADGCYRFGGPGNGMAAPWIRLFNTDTHTERTYFMENYHLPHVFIDVFPVDGSPDSSAEVEKQRKHITRLRRLQLWQYSKWGTGKGAAAVIGKGVLGPLLRLALGPTTITDAIERSAKHYPFETSQMVNSTVISNFNLTPFPKEWFDDIISIPFEGHELPAFANYEGWLEGRYGDWRTPVKDENRHFAKVTSV